VIPGSGAVAFGGAESGLDSLGRVTQPETRSGATAFGETRFGGANFAGTGFGEADLDGTGLDETGLEETGRGGSGHGKSKRRRTAEERRRASVRTAALTALGAGLAIALPAILRLPSSTHVTLNSPEASGPALTAPQDSADPAGPGDPVGGGTAPRGRAVTAPQSAASISAGGPAASPASASQTTAKPAGGANGANTNGTSAGTATAPLAGPTTQISASLAAEYENEVVTLTNAQRAAAGCGALHVDTRIQAAAIAHSVDMRARGYFTHNSADGETPWQRMADEGYTTPSAENIAMGQATPQDVVTAWMNSPGHRANILNCSSKSIGVGVQFGPGGPWWTQDFGYV
jgi:uncharacterized protein YkwD